MGPKHSNNKDKINKNHFEFLYVIGKGGFGKVWRVIFKKYKNEYALKEMSKVKIIDRKSEKSIMYERDLLSKLKSNFIVNMHFAFQDYDNLYLVMDLLSGGDLRYHISKEKKFTEEQTKFFVGCIIIGLEYIHDNKIIHRDIKPENLVLDDKGYLRITDFGVAKLQQKENSSETSGTPGYMAPEVMCAQNHTFAVDLFALGVLTYEFMLGIRPYLGRSRKEIKELILSKQVQLKKCDIPSDWTEEAGDFINKLLIRKPTSRLGYNGINELKQHPWLISYNWNELQERKTNSPFIPKNGDNFDKRYCESGDKIGNETIERYQKYFKCTEYTGIFRNYTFYNIDILSMKKTISVKSTIDSAIMTRRDSVSGKKFLNTNKKKIINNSEINNISFLKLAAYSPLKVYEQIDKERTPLATRRVLKENKSLIVNKSLIKLYSNTPNKITIDNNKQKDKLPKIDMKKLNINNMTKSTSVSNIKKSSRYSTISIESSSDLRSINFKKEVISLNKKKPK